MNHFKASRLLTGDELSETGICSEVRGFADESRMQRRQSVGRRV